jgi:hypothetical protein
LQITNLQVTTTSIFYKKYEKKIYVILDEHCMKWTPLSRLRGSNYFKTRKKRIILESSRKLANGVFTVYWNTNEIVVHVTIRMYENRYIACHGNIGQTYKHTPGSGQCVWDQTKIWGDSGAPDGWAVPAPLVVPVVLILSQTR